MKKLLALFLLTAAIITTGSLAVGAADFGSGVAVIANDVTMIKGGLIGERVVFSDSDFKTAMGTADFKTVKIEQLPSSTEGKLMLQDRAVRSGETIKRRRLAELSFIPNDKSVSESSFTFSIPELSGEKISCLIKFTEKVNYAPKIDTDASKTASVVTQSGVCVYGNLYGNDPEGDDIEYIIVSYPSSGNLVLCDKETGEYKYTPTKASKGKDSFVYVIRDEYGNYSKPEKVTLSIIERMSEAVYADMKDSKSYNAALAMTAMGIMDGTRVGDDVYFYPESGVKRAEFVAMAMKAAGIKPDSTLSESYFDDNSEIEKALVGYVATAAKCGIVNGSFDGEKLSFRPNDMITKCEAAIILSRLLDLKSTSNDYSGIEGILDAPVWARSEIGAMYEAGIFTDESELLSLNESLSRADTAEYLYKIASR